MDKHFSILEYKVIYTSKDCLIPQKDTDGNLQLPENVFESIEKFYYVNADVQQYFAPARKHGYKALRAQNYVGVIQTKDGTTIEILPKIQQIDEEESKKVLIKMLKTLRQSPFKNFNMANLKSTKMPLLEIFITMFLEELSKLVQKGIKSDYVTKEENLKFLKGKLLIGQQIKHNTVHRERFFVEYQEFNSDRIENRLIKTTLEYLYKKSKSSRNQQRIREFLFVFDEISPCNDVKIAFSKVRLNRQMKDYEQVLLWCKTFLLENSFSPYKGNDVAFALLFDMNLLFESYVGHYLKMNHDDVQLQDKTHHLACLNGTGKFQLKPDIVIDKGKVIADTKWKLLYEDKTHQGVSQADMYQLFAYGKKYTKSPCEKLFLIYPKQVDNESLLKHTYHFETPVKNPKVCSKGLDLQILFFDLSKDLKDSNSPPIEQFWKEHIIEDNK